MRLVLASASPYRRELLARLSIEFDTLDPRIDEAAFSGENPGELVTRLSMAKAKSGVNRAPDAIVIGSDQIASLDGCLLGKPNTMEAAARQLQAMAGQEVIYYTAVAAHTSDDHHNRHLDTSRVQLRPLALSEIERYLEAEKPLDCAGALKLEGLGISLCESIETRDPTALIGLPLIATAQLLRNHGFAVP